MLYLNDQKKYPVQVVMRDIVIQGDTSEITGSVNIIATNYKYAVIIISIVPILLVYPLLQKYFTRVLWSEQLRDKETNYKVRMYLRKGEVK